MKHIDQKYIDCKDLKVFLRDSKENELFVKEFCQLLELTDIIDINTKDGKTSVEGMKSWKIIVDDINIKYIFGNNKLFLTFTDGVNKYSGEAFIKSNNIIQGSGKLFKE